MASDDFREHLENALTAAGSASASILAPWAAPPIAVRLFSPVVLADLARMAGELREAARQVPPPRSHTTRTVLVVGAAVVVAALYNPVNGRRTRRRLQLALSGDHARPEAADAD